jgi:superfamily II DNA helicase RecQ
MTESRGGRVVARYHLPRATPVAELHQARPSQSRVVSVIVDEAHVVSRWGHSFRKKYSELGIIRAFLPRGTPIIALSATLARRVRRDVLRTLAIQKEHVLLDLGNDRPNVALAVRAMQHTATSFADLDFVIPEKARQPSSKPTDVPPTWIFFDSINGAIGMIDHIEDLLPEHLRRKGLVRPFSAAMAQEYRTEVLELFKEGVVRVLVCTDAAGMVRSLTFASNHR